MNELQIKILLVFLLGINSGIYIILFIKWWKRNICNIKTNSDMFKLLSNILEEYNYIMTLKSDGSFIINKKEIK